MSQSCYLFTREQLLRALEDHANTLDADAAERMRITVLAFIDGDAAKANGLQFTPSAIGTEPAR